MSLTDSPNRPALLSKANRTAAAILGIVWYAIRPIALFALPGAVDDAATWRGWFAMMPDWVWGLLLFLFGVWVGAAWYPAVRSALRPEWPNFDELDGRDRFKLWEAACFWVDQQAKLPLSGAAKQRFKELGTAAITQTLKVVREDLRETIYDAADQIRGREVTADPTWVVTRESLLTYARAIGEKPRFLFPKERA